MYNETLIQLLDKHAPAESKVITIKPYAPWYNEEVREAKRCRRRAERRMVKSGLCIHKQLYKKECEAYYNMLFEAKSKYLKCEIKESNTKQLFEVVKRLSTPNRSAALPDHSSDEDLANNFGEFFENKISLIVSSFDDSSHEFSCVPAQPGISPDCNLSEFDPVPESRVKSLIKSLSSKSSSLDPIPTWLVKACLDELLPLMTQIINLSLSSGVVPEQFKTAHVVPLLKKPGLERNDLKNYRPIANLPFLSKVLEKLVAAQLRTYLDENSLFPPHQSAYRHFHSTETALVRVLNDLLLALDKGQEAVLIILDYSAAFDTLDHHSLLHRLESDCGIKGTVLHWIESYLEGRNQEILVNGTRSRPFSLPYGVPQGSVVGPLMYILYTGPLGRLINSHHGMQHATYADDTQIYLIMSSSDHEGAMLRLSACINDVKRWSFEHKLKLNELKTEMLHLSSKFRNTDRLPSLNFESGSISSSERIRDLGVILDKNLTLNHQIKSVCRSASWGVCKIGKIRRYLDKSSTERLVHAFNSSHLDYCNGLLAGLPYSHIAPLQRIQNTAARLVTRTKKSDHISPILQSLHWLQIQDRNIFKVLLLIFKINHNLAPPYLQDLVSLRSASTSSTTRRLRSATTANLQLSSGPRTNTRYGDRAFSSLAPKLWNNLPVSIRQANTLDSFKSNLKTYLFRKCYLCR